jgi:hypothetical protein
VNDFLDLGSYEAVRKTLQRLASDKAIQRIDDGLYYRPRSYRLTGQANPPDPRQVIDAVARRSLVRVLVDGMTAANDLGLTDAVPAKIVVHTDARLRPIHLGNLTISFKPTAASKLFWAGRPAGDAAGSGASLAQGHYRTADARRSDSSAAPAPSTSR